MSSLSDLPKIGEKLEEQLQEIGINTYDELTSIGSTEAWLKIKKMILLLVLID